VLKKRFDNLGVEEGRLVSTGAKSWWRGEE